MPADLAARNSVASLLRLGSSSPAMDLATDPDSTDSLSMLSLKSAACLASLPSMMPPRLAASSRMALRPAAPPLRTGTNFAPDLPKASTASAVLAAPSSNSLNLSAISAKTASAVLSLPLASVTLMPMSANRAPDSFPPAAASCILTDNLVSAAVMSSNSTPFILPAKLSALRSSTEMPRRSEASFSLSRLSMAPVMAAEKPAPSRPVARPPAMPPEKAENRDSDLLLSWPRPLPTDAKAACVLSLAVSVKLTLVLLTGCPVWSSGH